MDQFRWNVVYPLIRETNHPDGFLLNQCGAQLLVPYARWESISNVAARRLPHDSHDGQIPVDSLTNSFKWENLVLDSGVETLD